MSVRRTFTRDEYGNARSDTGEASNQGLSAVARGLSYKSRFSHTSRASQRHRVFVMTGVLVKEVQIQMHQGFMRGQSQLTRSSVSIKNGGST